MIRKDNWFVQKDIISLIDNHVHFKKEWTIIYESRESSLEHFTYLSIPIKLSCKDSVIQYVSWSNDDENTLKSLLQFNGKQFMSLSFRRYFELYYWGDEYYSKSKEKYAILEKDDIAGMKYKKCSVRTDKLKEYLRFTKQLLLLGFRSHRYSERSLSEFGLKKSEKKFSSERSNYILNYQGMTNRELSNRPRAKSMSMVFGKYIVVK